MFYTISRFSLILFLLISFSSSVFSLDNRWTGALINKATGDTTFYNAHQMFNNGCRIPDFNNSNSSLNTEFYFRDTACYSRNWKLYVEYVGYGNFHLNYGINMSKEIDNPTFSSSYNAPSALRADNVQSFSFERSGNVIKSIKNGVHDTDFRGDYCPSITFYFRFDVGGGYISRLEYYDYDNDITYIEDFSNPDRVVRIGGCADPHAHVLASAIQPDCDNPVLQLDASVDNGLELSWVDPDGNPMANAGLAVDVDAADVIPGWYRAWSRVNSCFPPDVDSVYVDFNNMLKFEEVRESYKLDQLDAYFAAYGDDAPSTSGLHVFSDTIPAADGELCSTVVNRYVFIEYADIVPDKFVTPNGDGINDVWGIQGLDFFNKFTVRIFDRWGVQLAEFVDEFNGWDTMFNGRPVPSSDYWYVIDMEDSDECISGHFSVLR